MASIEENKNSHRKITIYIYIYIYIYLLTYYLPAFTVTRKKNRQYLDIIISRITTREEKEKKYHRTKKKKKNRKKRPTSSDQLKKIKTCNQLVKRKSKRKPTVKCCNATITESAQYKVEPITKIKSGVGPFLLKFRLIGSSGNLESVLDSLMSRWGETLVGKARLAI